MKRSVCAVIQENPKNQKSILNATVVFLGLICICGSGMLCFPHAASGTENSIYVSAESFTWKEFSDTQKLLEESGPLCGLEFSGNVGGNPSRPLAFHYKGKVFLGYIDYDGQTQDGTPMTTDTRYLGVKTEGGIGWKIFLGESGFSLEPLAGLGYRWWIRDITDSSSGGGYGYEEIWSSYYGRMGVRGAKRFSGPFEMFVEAAVIAPFYNQNIVDLSEFGFGTVTVEPGNETSNWAEAGFTFKKLRFSVFYEGLRFSESEKEGLYRFYQPESEADSYGATIGLTF